MKKIILILATVASSIAVQAQAKSFGGDVPNTNVHKSAEIVDLLKDTKLVENITIIGTVKNVCQAKGCWMTVDAGGGQLMTVKFKDYAFFMPKDLSGKQVSFTGKASKEVISVAELKHYAEDAGKSKKEIAKIKKPKEEYRFEASGVLIND